MIYGEYQRAAETFTEQNYNIIDGWRNNIEIPKEEKTNKDRASFFEKLQENKELLILGARKKIRERKIARFIVNKLGYVTV